MRGRGRGTPRRHAPQTGSWRRGGDAASGGEASRAADRPPKAEEQPAPRAVPPSHPVVAEVQGEVAALRPENESAPGKAWNVYFDDASFLGRDPEEYMRSMALLGGFRSLARFWVVHGAVMLRLGDMPPTFNVRVFRDGVRPVWEDPANMRGGRWSFRFHGAGATEGAARLHEEMLVATLEGRAPDSDGVCGVVLHVRPQRSEVQVWVAQPCAGAAAAAREQALRKLFAMPAEVTAAFVAHSGGGRRGSHGGTPAARRTRTPRTARGAGGRSPGLGPARVPMSARARRVSISAHNTPQGLQPAPAPAHMAAMQQELDSLLPPPLALDSAAAGAPPPLPPPPGLDGEKVVVTEAAEAGGGRGVFSATRRRVPAAAEGVAPSPSKGSKKGRRKPVATESVSVPTAGKALVVAKAVASALLVAALVMWLVQARESLNRG